MNGPVLPFNAPGETVERKNQNPRKAEPSVLETVSHEVRDHTVAIGQRERRRVLEVVLGRVGRSRPPTPSGDGVGVLDLAELIVGCVDGVRKQTGGAHGRQRAPRVATGG